MAKKTGRKKTRYTELALHNGVIESRFNFNPLEIKTLFAIAYKIQSKERGQNIIEYLKESSDEMLYYTVQEIAQIVGIQKNAFHHFERILDQLMKTVITIKHPDDPNGWIKLHFLNKAEYRDGIIILKPEKEMLPFYTKLTQNYTPLELSTIMSFKSIYSIRIYTLIKQYKNLMPMRIFKIEEFKDLLGITKAYTAIKDFRINVLEPAKKELNAQLPELNFDYELIKLGRAYDKIRFRFNWSAVRIDTVDLDLHSQAFDCFSKKDFGRRCVGASAPANNKVCRYCFEEIKTRY